MESGFPLAANKLPQLHIDRSMVRAWRREAHAEVANILCDRESWYYKGQEPKYAYKLIYNKRDLEGYICTTEAARRKEFYAHGVLKMYLEDVSFGLYADNTLDQRSVSAFLDEDAFLDAAVLQVEEHQTFEDLFCFSGVKWAAHHSPQDVDVHADTIYFECSFTARDADNRTVLVQYIKSPDLLPKQVHESHATTCLARGQHFQITTFRMDDDGGTYCQSAGTLVASEAIPSWVGMKTVLQAFSSLSNLVALADARAVARLGVAKAQSASKVCYLCKKKFGLTRKRNNCRSCGHSICKHCTVKLKFCNTEALQAHGHVPLLAEDKFCLPCVRRARDERPVESDDVVAKFVDSIVSDESSGDVAIGIPIDTNDLHDYSGDEAFDSDADTDEVGSAPTALSTTMRVSRDQRRRQDKTPSYYRTNNPARAFAAQASAGDGNDPTRDSNDSDSGRHRRVYPDLDGLVDGLVDLSASGHRIRRPQSARGGFPDPNPAAFNKLTESIAAQEALLQNIEYERQKFLKRRASPPMPHVPQYIDAMSPRRESTRNGDRFEVISEAY